VLIALAVAMAAPAAAENPVFDADTAADIAAGLAEATEVQGICYSVSLDVADPTGQWSGTYVVSSAGPDKPPPDTGCKGLVQLRAYIQYASEYSESEDTAYWEVASDVGGVSEDDLTRNGFAAGTLLDDDNGELELLNAALALPRLVAENNRNVPPLVLTPATEGPPADARATDRPGSDRLRENETSVFLLGAVALGALAWAISLVRPRRLSTYRLPRPEHL
jgi:hypothetical protein